MNPQKRLNQLQAEMKEHGYHVQLELTPKGIKIVSGSFADRLLAAAELRRRHITLHSE